MPGEENETRKVDGSYLLKAPIKAGDTEISVVSPKRLTGKDLLAVEDEIMAREAGEDYGSIGSARRMAYLIARSCGLVIDDVLAMDAADVNGLSAMVQDFL